MSEKDQTGNCAQNKQLRVECALGMSAADYAYIGQTEKTDTGLDVLIQTNSGKWVAWAYNIETGNAIAAALNRCKRNIVEKYKCDGCVHNT